MHIRKARINSISQSSIKITAGKGIEGFDDLFDFASRNSPLKNESAFLFEQILAIKSGRHKTSMAFEIV